eukprot:m.84731 g.84731  ORF g.84731 m.84731 type:complete len:726 (-) comp14397_c1_seq1:95-2272(-)
MAMQHRVKIGCVLPENPSALPKLLEVQPGQTLSDIIHELCHHFKVDDEAHYSLRITETSQYVTSENCNDVLRDGIVLQLATTADGLTNQLVKRLKSSVEKDKTDAIVELKKETQDFTVAKAFCEGGGVELLFESMEVFRKSASHSPLAYTLQTLANILHHELADLAQLHQKHPNLLNDVLRDVASDHPLLVRFSLQLLAVYVLRMPEVRDLVQQTVPHLQLIQYIKEHDYSTQEAALALLNAIISVTEIESEIEALYRLMADKNVFRALGSRDFSQSPIPREYAHELYVFQRLWLRRLVQRAGTQFDWANQEGLANLELLISCLPSLSEKTDGTECSSNEDKYRLLGFKDPTQPQTEFMEPPGMLTLDALTYWVRNSEDSFTRLAADQISRPDQYTCPFVGMAKAMLRVLLELLHADEAPTKDGTDYLPILYTSRHAFFEMFLASMQLALRTWREMEAKVTDLPKVLAMVKKQILRVFSLAPEVAPSNMDDFKQMLFKQSFQDMLEDQKREILMAEERLMTCEPVLQLRAKLREDIVRLVREQRFAQMQRGAWFGVVGRAKKAKGSRFFMMLSPNHKTLHWSDVVDRDVMTTPSLRDLPHSCDATEIKVIYVGNEVPSIESSKKKVDDIENVFAILATNMDEPLEMTGPNGSETSIWLDGFRALIDQEMKEPSTIKEIVTLEKVETRLRILNLHGLDVASRAPTVPALPDDMNFVYADIEEGANA